MDLSGIISISGKSGLSKIVSQGKNGIIVESLQESKRFPVHGNERVSSLEDISIYTYENDVLLSEVFEKIYDSNNGQEILSHKSDASELKTFFKNILPDYDEERVYNSDIKKVVQWYNLLISKGLLQKEDKKKNTKPKKESAQNKAKSTSSTKEKINEEVKSDSDGPIEGYGDQESVKKNSTK